ncbi:hypothetical protein KIN20_005732 [Parelaphostrongylus tenuis]|uniref:Uncharacterized protein n=1 Tax=Parelaphostrongylus tenuis TaxID=148309 RepID=A0AAD5M2L1_PARTN|nr:hypothetical protein KIN20_005732 [Parelaphostrongylus tenuis]
MLKKLNEERKKIGLRIISMKTQFIKNQWCSDENIRLNRSLITETSVYVNFGRSLNSENNVRRNLTEEVTHRGPHLGLSNNSPPSTLLCSKDMRCYFNHVKTTASNSQSS